MANIHPTAVVDSGARLADDVTVGPFCIVESDVEIGAGSVLRSHAVVRRYTTLGMNNTLDSFVVLGGEPQDVKFDPDSETYLRIGDNNAFREGVTISRATAPGQASTVGNDTYWMANSHAGHDTTIHDGVTLANAALVAGHSTIGPRAILSGGAMVHEFTWIGEMVMSRGMAGISQHVPPFVMVAGINSVAGLNVVGLKRSPNITDEDRAQVKEAFAITYRRKLTPAQAVEEMDACSDWGAPASRFRQFVRDIVAAEKPFNRGLCPMRGDR